MIDPRERVLEMAIAEELSGRVPPDLALRILIAARRGGVRARPGVPAGRRLRVVAAALLLAVAAGAAFWLAPGRPHATGTAKLRVIAADGAERWDERFAEGEWVVTEDGDGAVVTLRSGADLVLGPRTALHLVRLGRDPALRLAAGRARLSVPAGSRLTVATPGGPLRAGPGAAATVEVLTDPWRPPAEFPETARSLARREGESAGPVYLGVEAGVVEAGSARAGAGESLWIAPGGPAERGTLPPPGVRRRVDELLAAARPGEADLGGEGPELFRALKEAEAAAEELAEYLGADGARWDFAVPRLALLPGAAARSEVRARLLRVLAAEPGRRSDGLLSRALAVVQDSFDPDTVLRLAERGLAPAVDRVAASVAGADAPELRVLPAAFFAFRGDTRGREALLPAEGSEEFLRARPLDWLAAAAGLAALEGPERWGDSMARLREVLTPALDAGQTEYVRWFALAARYFRPAALSHRPVRLSRLGYAVEDFLAERSSEARTPADLRALLASLAD
ncbi:MAG: hypothetical protein MUE73_21330 [Planctomycetes bacterium]|nr:hypothetical protein [Planctomycetota bacterium]